MASDNIVNQLADSSKSLYQICRSLQQRLTEVPGFEEHLKENNYDDGNSEDDTDPVTSMWRCLRRGYPLMTIYNALNPPQRLEIDESKVTPANRPKKASFLFVNACLRDLNFPPDECFVITDLFGDDTTGFVKVTKVVSRVLDMLKERNLLRTTTTYDSDTETITDKSQKRTYRDHVVAELVDTERKYVQDLEVLQTFKKLVQESGAVAGDVIFTIFMNLNALLDFQRRFLIRVETTNTQPQDMQNWGLLFLTYEEAFRVYEPYIANQHKCTMTAEQEFENLKSVGHPITVDWTTFSGFLLKPVQRLTKYPLLLKDLRDKTDASPEQKADLNSGYEASQRVLERANDAVDRIVRAEAVDDLAVRVEDWKGHKIEQFGELLLYGTFTVVKGDGRNDVEREYKIYLFERILLCCKEYNPNKQKNKVMSMNKPAVDKKGKPKLQLKGRIFMQNVTDTLCLTKPGSYTVQIWWKGDPGVENFIIRFQSEETMKKWYNMVDRQVKIFQEAERRSGRTSTSTKTSDTEFAWQKNQGAPMENPYQQTDDGDDDEDDLLYGSQDPTVYTPQSEFSMSRNASSTSLRSRSTTGDSGPPMAQVGYPGGLSRSNVAASPSERLMNSYFSPVVESPMSSRTSSSSGMYPFPRQATPNGSFHEEHNRFTAPAMGRTASRDGQSVSPVYQMNNRAVQRPSLPAMAPQVPMPQPPMTQNRMRSASSPDIHNPSGQPRRGLPNGPSPHPPMPPFPAHIAHINGAAGINRSQNNSPTTLPNMLPIRSATQSPGVQRERLAQQMYQSQYGADPPRSDPRVPPPLRTGTSTASSVAESVSPTMTVSSQNSDGYQAAVQLKVKVTFLDNYVTLVVSSNIKYQSLANRIDHKLARSTTLSIGNGNLRLRYKDEDGDFVTIHSDDDIQMAITDWREQQRGNVVPAGMAEIQLYCQTIEN